MTDMYGMVKSITVFGLHAFVPLFLFLFSFYGLGSKTEV